MLIVKDSQLDTHALIMICQSIRKERIKPSDNISILSVINVNIVVYGAEQKN
jgi:hypothetical protein